MTTCRLAAIMEADIAGYSRLMHADEEATHARSTNLMAGMIEPTIAGHGGRIVKLTGSRAGAAPAPSVSPVSSADRLLRRPCARSRQSLA